MLSIVWFFCICLNNWDPAGDFGGAHRGIFEGRFTDLYATTPKFDTAPALLFWRGKYHLYNRLNFAADGRFIQRSVSETGVDWSEYQPIEIDGFDFEPGHSFYTPSISVLNSTTLIMMPTETRRVTSGYRVEPQIYYSTDGLRFTRLDSTEGVFTEPVSSTDYRI